MNVTSTYQLINEKLKNAPQSVLERVLGYVDAILESTTEKPYQLSQEQQNILDSQVNDEGIAYQNVEDFEKSLNKKYDL